MKIMSSDIQKDLLDKILTPDPLEGEDIIIEDKKGNIVGVILQPDAYSFFLDKVKEKENELDSSLDEEYDSSAPSLDDLMEES